MNIYNSVIRIIHYLDAQLLLLTGPVNCGHIVHSLDHHFNKGQKQFNIQIII